MTCRHIFAWLLLLAVSIQWIGGVLYVKVSESSLIELKMTQAENILAEKVEQEFGIESDVRILNSHDYQAMLFAGYGTPFIFSHEERDSIEFFTLKSDNTKVIISDQQVSFRHQGQERDQMLVSLNKLFSPIIANYYLPQGPYRLPAYSDQQFTYLLCGPIFDPQVLTPPPLPSFG